MPLITLYQGWIMSLEVKMVDISSLRPNPKNNNRHTIEQINRLAKILDWQDFRSPIIVSNQSGYIVCGHARLEAALTLGMTQVPVSFQDFESDEQEYAHMTADNEIARWSELDFDQVKMDVLSLNIDPDYLGIQKLEPPSEKEDKEVYEVVVHCRDELGVQHISSVIENEGFKFKVKM